MIKTITTQNGPLKGPVFWAAALFLIVVWGTAFTMVDVGVRYMSPIWLVAYRTLLAAILICLYAFYKGVRFPPLKDPRWKWYFGLGVTGMTLPFFLVSWGQETIDSGLSAILVGVMPLITIVLAHFLTSEKLSWRKVLGFAIGLIGTIILFLPDDFSFSLIKDWKAQCLVLGGAFCYAVTTVGAKLAPETPALQGAAMMTLSAAITAIFFALLNGRPPVAVPLIGWLMIAGLAIGSTGIATIIYLQIIDSNGPTTLARINYFPPFASVLAGIWFLGEPFTARIGVAFATIMLGVWIAKNKNPKVTVPQSP